LEIDQLEASQPGTSPRRQQLSGSSGSVGVVNIFESCGTVPRPFFPAARRDGRRLKAFSFHQRTASNS
jgi:hypothetical protein